jgi:uncharacterized membrane protein YeaQ/YmgE (transglycosylase-associated protein family)
MINMLLWLLFGVLTGLVVSRLSNRRMLDTIIMNSIAGVLGAMIAGFVFLIFDVTPLNLVNIWASIFAFAGAVVGISLVQVLVRNLI